MKVLALNGSQNPKGVTYHAIQLVAEELAKENIGLDIVHVGVKAVAGCMRDKLLVTRFRLKLLDRFSQADAGIYSFRILKALRAAIEGSPS